MEDCIFCKIVKGQTDTNLVTQTANLVVFPDIHPSAPTHFLIIPKKHIQDMTQADDALWLEIKNLAMQMAKERQSYISILRHYYKGINLEKLW